MFSTLERYRWDTMILAEEVSGRNHLFYMEGLGVLMTSVPHELWYPPNVLKVFPNVLMISSRCTEHVSHLLLCILDFAIFDNLHCVFDE